MEKRYQVFISSTFQDLQGARQEVSQALLRADCFPAGMELFPAADEEQFEFIKTVIDQSDYYILISAGRYGSIHPETGLSYTEMEYDYAVETGKPVIRLLHKDPFNELKGEFIEQTDAEKNKLQLFREKLMKGKMVRFWSVPAELMVETVFGLQDAQKRHPAIGWVKSSAVMSATVALELADLREQTARNKQELDKKVTHSLKFDAGLVDSCLRKINLHRDKPATVYQLAASIQNNLESSKDLLGKQITIISDQKPLFEEFGFSDDAVQALKIALETEGLVEGDFLEDFTSVTKPSDKLLKLAYQSPLATFLLT